MVANFPDSILVVVRDHRSRPSEISDAARAGVLQVEESLQLGLVATSSESCRERPLQLAGKTISVGLLFVFDQLQIDVDFVKFNSSFFPILCLPVIQHNLVKSHCEKGYF